MSVVEQTSGTMSGKIRVRLLKEKLGGHWAKVGHLWGGLVRCRPEVADWILTNCAGPNRPLRRKHKRVLGEQMKTNWQLNCQALIFDNCGILQEGYHRCTTSREQGLSFATTVWIGAKEAARRTQDHNQTRLVSDIISTEMDNAPYTNAIAGTARLLRTFLAGGSLAGGLGGSTNSPSRLDMADFIMNDLPGLPEAVAEVMRMQRGPHHITDLTRGPRCACAPYYIFSHVDHALAKMLYEAICLYENIPSTGGWPTVKAFVKRLSRKTAGEDLKIVAITSTLVRVWNAVYTGNPLKEIKIATTAKTFPKIEGLEYRDGKPRLENCPWKQSTTSD